jgi:molybdopterin-guanine dinucleotide biosynthesis protein A
LAGIHAALSQAKYDHCLVVACDMPFLSPGLLARMARERRDFDVLVPQLAGQSRQGTPGLVYQTLHAIYARSALPAIAVRWGEGKRQVVSFFPDVRVRTLDQDEIERWDPELRSFFNANTPELLAEARVLRGGGEQPAGRSR